MRDFGSLATLLGGVGEYVFWRQFLLLHGEVRFPRSWIKNEVQSCAYTICFSEFQEQRENHKEY
jgi:hypothetical protein